MKTFFTLLIASLLLVPSQNSLAVVPKQLSKTLLTIYQDHRQTFFCEQPFSDKGTITVRPCAGCAPMDKPVQWMPIVPLQELAGHLLCYREKMCSNHKGERYQGLRCCQKIDPLYQQMRHDLHNYVPEVPSLKQLRKDFRFGIVSANIQPELCYFHLDKQHKIIEPAPNLRGMIARTYLYMKDRYHLPLSLEDTELYLNWHRQYPVSEFERERNKRIKERQGNGNPYVG